MTKELKLATLATGEAASRGALYRIKNLKPKIKCESHSMYQFIRLNSIYPRKRKVLILFIIVKVALIVN